MRSKLLRRFVLAIELMMSRTHRTTFVYASFALPLNYVRFQEVVQCFGGAR